MEFTKFDYHGFEGLQFEFDGLPAKIVMPKVKPNGKWCYKTEYFNAFPETELEFLNRGYRSDLSFLVLWFLGKRMNY